MSSIIYEECVTMIKEYKLITDFTNKLTFYPSGMWTNPDQRFNLRIKTKYGMVVLKIHGNLIQVDDVTSVTKTEGIIKIPFIG